MGATRKATIPAIARMERAPLASQRMNVPNRTRPTATAIFV
jgi:hypothetical protein